MFLVLLVFDKLSNGIEVFLSVLGKFLLNVVYFGFLFLGGNSVFRVLLFLIISLVRFCWNCIIMCVVWLVRVIGYIRMVCGSFIVFLMVIVVVLINS